MKKKALPDNYQILRSRTGTIIAHNHDARASAAARNIVANAWLTEMAILPQGSTPPRGLCGMFFALFKPEHLNSV